MIVMIAVTAAMLLAFIHVLRLVTTFVVHRTISKAIDRDPQKADAMIARLGDPASGGDDDRFATILIAVGLAMIAASIVVNDPRWMHYGVAAALFPLLVGTALWLRLFIQRRTQRAATE
jgi:protein-S-isoprenylcysteine O-methyltransferase Ste14